MLLLSNFAFTGSGECAFYPTPFKAPTQMPCAHTRTPNPPSVLVLSCTRSHMRHRLSLSQEHLSVRDGRDVKPQTACGFSLSSYLISFASRAACEVGEALSSRRAVRPSHTPL